MKEKKNNKVFVSLDHRGYNQKPNRSEMPGISNRIPHNSIYISVEELAKKITMPDAQSWSPANYKESCHKNTGEMGLWRQKTGWKEQQLFALDIDEGISSQEAVERCKRLNILPVFIYTTFSDTEFNKFRIVFMLQESIKNDEIRNLIQISLMKIFPETDQQCKDASRLYYGGKQIIYQNYDARIDIHQVIHAAGIYLKEKDPNNYSKNYQRYCNSVGLNSLNGSPNIKVVEISEEDKPETTVPHLEKCMDSCMYLYRYYRKSHKTIQKYTITLEKVNCSKATTGRKSKNSSLIINTPERSNLIIVDFDELSNRCKLYNQFLSGEYWAYHHELFALATNLTLIRGGEAKFFEGLESNAKYRNKKSEFGYYINYIKRQNYQPERCDRFCPFHDECSHLRNILTTVKVCRNKITVVKEQKTITLKDAETKLSIAFETARIAEDKKIYLIKAPTGIGKTEAFLSFENAIIAVPTHKLKDEISARMEEKQIRHFITPELPEIIDEFQIKKLESLYAIGAFSAANRYLRKLAKNSIEIAHYFSRLDHALKSDSTVVTTHERMLYFKNKNLQTLVIDEDPLQTLLKISSVEVKDLLYFLSYIEMYDDDNSSIAKDISEMIKRISQDKFCKMGSYNWKYLNKKEIEYSDWLLKENINTNVLGFLYASYFIKVEGGSEKIQFIQKRVLPNIKIIILSATVDEEIYRKLYGDRVVFIDIGAVEMKGKLIQYPEYSFSRYSLKENESRMKLIQKLTKDSYVITYKILKDKFENSIGHFHALRGIDEYKGEDISIVGTTHINPITYALFALALDHAITYADMKMSYSPVEHNGYRFYFQIFSENEFLRNIQLHLIESELIQAIGRARLLRYDCTVTLYSNFPIQGAEFFYLTDKDKKNIIDSDIHSECIEKELLDDFAETSETSFDFEKSA